MTFAVGGAWGVRFIVVAINDETKKALFDRAFFVFRGKLDS